MIDRELSAAAEEDFRRLHELFGSAEPAPRRQSYRRYLLEYRDGGFIFRDAISGPAHPRSDLELALHRIFDEVLYNDIVPQKLAKAFPGSSFELGRY
jgi:hypothetical protein